MLLEMQMKAALIAACLLASSGFATAETIKILPEVAAENEVITALYEADLACTQGTNHDGDKLSDAQIKDACVNQVALIAHMKADLGYCFNAEYTDWWKCK